LQRSIQDIVLTLDLNTFKSADFSRSKLANCSELRSPGFRTDTKSAFDRHHI